MDLDFAWRAPLGRVVPCSRQTLCRPSRSWSLHAEAPSPSPWTGRGREAGSVLLSPLVAYFVLRMRGMAPVSLPDSSMHTIYIIDPREMFIRYSAALNPTARLRESAPGGVPPCRPSLRYLARPSSRFLRHPLSVRPHRHRARILLVRRLYGIPAAALAVVALLSSPVIITAWGTDYPNSAVVSYVAGAVACLAMPCRGRWRPRYVSWRQACC